MALLVIAPGCSGGSPEEEAGADVPVATRAPIPVGEVELPPLEFKPVDDSGTVAAEVTSEALFDLDSAELKPDADAIVQQVAQQLATTPAAVRVDGYTDGLGSTAHNLELSAARAKALADRIEALGTATEVFSCGRGEEGTDGESADPTRRRVVVTISVAELSKECP